MKQFSKSDNYEQFKQYFVKLFVSFNHNRRIAQLLCILWSCKSVCQCRITINTTTITIATIATITMATITSITITTISITITTIDITITITTTKYYYYY